MQTKCNPPRLPGAIHQSEATATVADIDDGLRSFTPDEVAGRISTNAEFVRRACRSGRIKATRWGTSWRIPADELRRILNHGLDATGDSAPVVETKVCATSLPPMIREEQAARWLALRKPEIRAQVKRGQLPGVFIGHHLRFPLDALATRLGLKLEQRADGEMVVVSPQQTTP